MFIGNFLLTLQPFIVPLSGLAPGRTQFQWHAEGQFFSGFENSEILDADLVVCAEVEKSGHTVGLDLDIEGSVVVACDRCLADLSVPVSERRSFTIKFGDYQADEQSDEEDGREVIMVPDTDSDLDLSQVVYDYVCISLPLSRVHPEGECDPETVKYLGSEDSATEDDPAAADSPFAALKDLFEKK